jgi:hypothetical protein
VDKLLRNISEYKFGVDFDSIILEKKIDFTKASTHIQNIAKNMRAEIKTSHEEKNWTNSLFFKSTAFKILDKAINEAKDYIPPPDLSQKTDISMKSIQLNSNRL